jgi:CubicO group peptidase (beta-lactamase class C family)
MRSRPEPPRRRLSLLLRIFGVLAISAVAVMGFATATTDRFYWSRIIIWRDADFDDWRRFPARVVAHDPANVRTLPRAPSADAPWPLPLPARFAGATNEPLEAVLAASGTAAFLVLHRQEIIYERYLNGYTPESTMTSFSVAKAFVSALIGRAIADGRIASIDDSITTYLPELAGRDLDAVTIANLLEMASGLRYEGSGSGGTPWQDDAKTYYDPDLRGLALTVERARPPGEEWQYNNYHPLLLGLILERTSGMSVSEYLSQELWQPMGAEAPGSWSLDSDKSGFEKMESGLNGRAADFARFGLLFAGAGAVDGKQLLPAAWVATSTVPKVKDDFGYFWWTDPLSDHGAFAARGNMGQLIYVDPQLETVVVRFGERRGDVDWLELARELAKQESANHQ